MMDELGFHDPEVLKEEFEELLQRNKKLESRLRHLESIEVGSSKWYLDLWLTLVLGDDGRYGI